MSQTLNSANYQLVWKDNFAANPSVNGGIFQVQWGDGGEFQASNGGLTLADDGNAAGFLTSDSGAGSGNGYGLYSVTFQENSATTGAYICLWPATNVWPGPEIDFCELLNGRAYMTVHWQGAGNTNQYQSYFFPPSVNFNQPTTIAADWEASGLTLYVGGQEVLQYKQGGSVPLPTDYAAGGQNEAFGAGLDGGDNGASITIYNMSYSKYVGTSGGGGSSGGGGGGSGGSTAPIQIANPGVVTGTAPVQKSITFTDPALAGHTIYAVTMNPNNAFEENWIPITLNNSGVGSHMMTFKETGDYVIAVSNESTEANKGVSGRITIKPPAASNWIAISSLGTVTSQSGVAQELVHFSDPGLAGCYALTMTSNNTAEGNWAYVPFNSAGQGSLNMTFAHTGDYVLAVANPNTEADKSWSSSIIIQK